MSLRLVTFDLDGTLYSNRRFYPGLVRRWFKAECAQGIFRAIRGAFAARAFQKTRESMRARGKVTDLRGEALAEACRHGRCSEDRMREVIDALIYENDFAGASAHVFPGAEDALRAFKRLGLKLAVLSDYPVDRKLQALGLASVEWDLVLSAEDVNALKPDPAIFEIACERLGVRPAEALHVGDRPDCDIAGAKAAGMRSILFSGEGPSRHSGPRADYNAKDYPSIRLIVETLASEK